MVVVLNADYSYLNTISEEDACVLLYKKVAVAVNDVTVKVFRSVKDKIVVPAVIRLLKYVRVIFRKEVPWSKRNVYLRDNYVCQYTGRKLKPSEATVDHIVPKARGGKSTFENCVTCAKDINQLKGDRTISEAGLKLLRRPYQPTIHEFIQNQLKERGIGEVLKEFGLL